jgi:5-methylcytosine-specific restriction endonuclease McrA
MTPEVGRAYYRKGKAGHALVVRVLSVAEWVEYEVVHGPRRALAAGTGRCKARNFVGWEQVEERDDYSHLDGCKLFATFLVLDTRGEPILRCSQKRADLYLRKGFARTVRDGVLQFADGRTERRLRELYGEAFSAFFLAVKNDRCVCCGAANDLSRHHVVPRRHRGKIPLPWRQCLSNVLFLCRACHRRYEATPEPDPEYGGDWQEYARRWKQHFLDALAPEHVPAGWDIVSVSNLEAVRDLD